MDGKGTNRRRVVTAFSRGNRSRFVFNARLLALMAAGRSNAAIADALMVGSNLAAQSYAFGRDLVPTYRRLMIARPGLENGQGAIHLLIVLDVLQDHHVVRKMRHAV